jgi:hypothetical protein
MLALADRTAAIRLNVAPGLHFNQIPEFFDNNPELIGDTEDVNQHSAQPRQSSQTPRSQWTERSFSSGGAASASESSLEDLV